MEEQNQSQPETVTQASPDAAASRQEGPQPDMGGGDQLRQRVDQISAIVGRALDLVEATIGLGVNLAARLGSVVQETTSAYTGDQPTEAPGTPVAPYPQAGPRPYGETVTAPAGQGGVGRGSEAATASPASYVTNRLPLFPAGPVQVSFTINNDSSSTPKKLRLRTEGFLGEMTGMVLDGSEFAVKPARKVIAPMDFEKFTLTGAIPSEAASDAYRGSIIVSDGQEELRIGVRLVVGGQPS